MDDLPQMDSSPPVENSRKRKQPPLDSDERPSSRPRLDVNGDPEHEHNPDDPDADPEPEVRSFTPPSPDTPANEYQNGRVICEICGAGVSFRDETTDGFTLKHWNEHRESCIAPALHDLPSAAAAASAPYSHPPAKRRRAKRTEEERVEYLRADPYVAQFEAYRVLCASCDKWIRLRPNSTYCSIPWDAHRKSCLAKKITSKNIYALDERNTLLAKDPDVRKFDAERVLCNVCDTWLALNPEDHAAAVQTWIAHRDTCRAAENRATARISASAAIAAPPSPLLHPQSAGAGAIASPDPASPDSHTHHTHTHTRTSHPAASPSSPSSHPAPRIPSSSSSTNPHVPHITSSTTNPPASSHAPIPTQQLTHPRPPTHLTPLTYAPAHESRRRNAEQRAATLRADPLVTAVEPNRVFCSLCGKWVQLRQDSSYCAYPWLQHRGKCLARSQRRAQKAAEVAEARARKFGIHHSNPHPHSNSHPHAPPQNPHPRVHHVHHAHGGRAVMSGSDEDHDERGLATAAEGDEEVESEEGVEEVVVVKREPESSIGMGRHVRGNGNGVHEREREREHGRQERREKVRYRDHGHVNGNGTRQYSAVPRHHHHHHHHHNQQHHHQHPHQYAHLGNSHHHGNGDEHPHPHRAYAHHQTQTHVIRAWHAGVPPDADAEEGEADAEGEADDVDVDAEGEVELGESEGDEEGGGGRQGGRQEGGVRRPARPAGLADLDSVSGRRRFIHASLLYLSRTTYERTDDIRVAPLLAYLNAAAPPDKHEDFDTGEVLRALGVLRERGKLRLEGDVVRVI